MTRQHSVRRPVFAAAAFAFAAIGVGSGCGQAVYEPDAAETPDKKCSTIDEVYYSTSRDLENAADVIVVGTITSIDLDEAAESGPTWVVGFDGKAASGIDKDKAMDANTIRLPKVCGDAPYGDTFAVDGRFIMLLLGPREDVFYPVNTTQGVVPIVDGRATPLARAGIGNSEAVTITRTTAAGMGA